MQCGVRGVSWHKARRLWQARISVQGKKISLGYYHDIDDAKKARESAEEKYFLPLVQEAENRDNNR